VKRKALQKKWDQIREILESSSPSEGVINICGEREFTIECYFEARKKDFSRWLKRYHVRSYRSEWPWWQSEWFDQFGFFGSSVPKSSYCVHDRVSESLAPAIPCTEKPFVRVWLRFVLAFCICALIGFANNISWILHCTISFVSSPFSSTCTFYVRSTLDSCISFVSIYIVMFKFLSMCILCS